MERAICEHRMIGCRRQSDTTDVILKYLGTWVRHSSRQHLAHAAARQHFVAYTDMLNRHTTIRSGNHSVGSETQVTNPADVGLGRRVGGAPTAAVLINIVRRQCLNEEAAVVSDKQSRLAARTE